MLHCDVCINDNCEIIKTFYGIFSVCSECYDNNFDNDCRVSRMKKEEIIVEAFGKITDESIEEAVESNFISHIFNGSKSSYRHDIYKKGSNFKRLLDDTCLLVLLSDAQQSILIRNLARVFAKDHPEFHDYILTVLIPESVILLIANTMTWGRLKTELFLDAYFADVENDEEKEEGSSSAESECGTCFIDIVKNCMISSERKRNIFQDKVLQWKIENCVDVIPPSPCQSTRQAKRENLKQKQTLKKYAAKEELTKVQDDGSDFENEAEDEVEEKEADSTEDEEAGSTEDESDTTHKLRKSNREIEDPSKKYETLLATRERLNKMIDAVEKEFQLPIASFQNHDESSKDITGKVQKKKRKTSAYNKIALLKKKRAAERKGRKTRNCVVSHLGAIDVVKERTYGLGKNKKRVFTFKCPECNETIQINLARHLEVKHKYTKADALFKQSELRVLFLWAKENKAGKQRPLPCYECKLWHLRLDHHLARKHNFTRKEQKCIIIEARGKCWSSSSSNRTEKLKTVAKEQPRSDPPPLTGDSSTSDSSSDDDNPRFIQRGKSTRSTKTVGLDYVPLGALLLNSDLRKKWEIDDDDFFHIYYPNKKKLMKAFVIDQREGIDNETAKQHAAQASFIWSVLDKHCCMFPKNVLANRYALQDTYHRPALKKIGKGGVEASTLRSRYTSLTNFVAFLRKRGIFAGLARTDMTNMMENISDLNKELGPRIRQRKVELRRQKKKQLMTVKHMISYGRSKHVQEIVKFFNRLPLVKVSLAKAIDTRDYLMCELSIMNGLRASNLIELRVQDVNNATEHSEYPGQKVIENIKYKTSSIYGEKLIALPEALFKQLLDYVTYCRPVLLGDKVSSRTFISTGDKCKLNQSNVSSSLTSSFKKAALFTKNEYRRVSCTRIRVACATFACNEGGIDMAYLAKHFMKNREETTALHYNMYANHRDALCIASLIGDSFQVYGGQKITLKDSQREDLTSSITKDKPLPTREEVLDWMKRKDPSISKEELRKASDLLADLTSVAKSNSTTFYGAEVSSDSEKDIDNAEDVQKVVDETEGNVSHSSPVEQETTHVAEEIIHMEDRAIPVEEEKTPKMKNTSSRKKICAKRKKEDASVEVCRKSYPKRRCNDNKFLSGLDIEEDHSPDYEVGSMDINAYTSETNEDSSDDDSTARSPNMKRQKLFPPKDIKLLKKYCAPVISGGQIKEDRVIDCLEPTPLLSKYSFQQLRTRINYERQKKARTEKLVLLTI